MDIINPAINEIISNVFYDGTKEAQLAVEAASAAFDSWSNLTAYDRTNILRNYFALIIAPEEELAKLTPLEMGKPITIME